MELGLVNREQADLLKKLGFDWETYYCYWVSDHYPNTLRSFQSRCVHENFFGDYKHLDNFNNNEDFVSVPTVALALKWCRDVKGVVGTIEFSFDFTFYYSVKLLNYVPGKGEASKLGGGFTNYEQAESGLLDEVLDILSENLV